MIISQLSLSSARAPLAATLLATAVTMTGLLMTAGCTANDAVKSMPGLAEVVPTNPEGKKCYDRCAHAEANCKFMCPKSVGICHDDCYMDTKICLFECPELHRPGAAQP